MKREREKETKKSAAFLRSVQFARFPFILSFFPSSTYLSRKTLLMHAIALQFSAGEITRDWQAVFRVRQIVLGAHLYVSKGFSFFRARRLTYISVIWTLVFQDEWEISLLFFSLPTVKVRGKSYRLRHLVPFRRKTEQNIKGVRILLQCCCLMSLIFTICARHFSQCLSLSLPRTIFKEEQKTRQ